LKITLVAGARPNFMKVAPIVHALAAKKEEARSTGVDLRLSIVHTGQHYDENMSDVFFRDLGIPKPDRHLEVGSGSHAAQTARIMVAFEKVLLEDRPDLVVVVGDVNSTIACALTAKKLGVRVAHVEAGLRSFDMGMPEEINRRLTDAISDLLFVTEESGRKNLRDEGVPNENIFLVGNVMIDTLRRNLARIESGECKPSETVREFCGGDRRYAVLTLHRPSNVDRKETLAPVWGAVSEVARQVPILFPVHPRTRGKIDAFGLNGAGVKMIDPIGYLDMLYAVKGAALVLTDSGGLQEETTALGVPCVTIRENTERPITVEIGTNYLAGTNPEAILAASREILSGNGKQGKAPPLWDGKAAERIVGILLDCFSS
jgi:UDP-N-acetylglucosamine 2-epimerase (non-hydrolysing)